MRLDQPIDVMGKFWLPEQSEEDGVIGRLTIQDGGDIQLLLYECFKNFDASKSFKEHEKFDVVGIIQNNFTVTLQGCFLTTEPSSNAKLIEMPLWVNIALLDHRQTHKKPFLIKQMRFHLEGLRTWLHYQDFSIKKNAGNEPYSLTWEKEESIDLGVCDGAKIELILKADYSSEENVKAVFKNPFIKISTPTPKELNKFISIVANLASFFSFACNNITTIKNATIYFGENAYKKATQIYYSSQLYVENVPNFQINNLLFSYDRVKHRQVALLKDYFVLCKEIHPALKLFHATQIHKRFLLESAFLTIAQALENVARYKKGDYKSKSRFALETELVDFLLPLKAIITEWTNFDALIRNIVDTRHYNTHHGIEVKNAKFGNDLFKLLLQTQSVFKLVILYELGFSLREIERIIENNYQLQQQLA